MLEGKLYGCQILTEKPENGFLLLDWTVLAMGHRDYVKEEARNARLQIIQADGNVSFVPIIQREDPDLTDHENISYILLNEELVQQSDRK